MFRIALCGLVLASVAAERIQVQGGKTKFGATCEDLRVTFGNRVDALQALLDAHPNEDSVGRFTQARFGMRTVGVARTLGRARECPWVLNGGNEDIEQMRGIVQSMLAGNPCAPVARAELDAGSSESDESVQMEAVQRALTILTSENCEAAALPADAEVLVNTDDEEELAREIDQAEQQAQDSVDEAMDLAMQEEEEGSSLVETGSKGRFGGFFRSLGVLLLVMVLMMACVSTLTVVGGFIAVMLMEVGIITVCRGFPCGLDVLFFGLLSGFGVGLAGCTYTLVTQLLPAVEVSNGLH